MSCIFTTSIHPCNEHLYQHREHSKNPRSLAHASTQSVTPTLGEATILTVRVQTNFSWFCTVYKWNHLIVISI